MVAIVVLFNHSLGWVRINILSTSITYGFCKTSTNNTNLVVSFAFKCEHMSGMGWNMLNQTCFGPAYQAPSIWDSRVLWPADFNIQRHPRWGHFPKIRATSCHFWRVIQHQRTKGVGQKRDSNYCNVLDGSFSFGSCPRLNMRWLQLEACICPFLRDSAICRLSGAEYPKRCFLAVELV